MRQENLNLSDPSSSRTINHYLREGSRLQSQQTWAMLHAIGGALAHKRSIQAPIVVAGALLLANSLLVV